MSEKQRRGKKRPKSYYLKCAHKKVKHGNTLDIDMRGFLVTCNGNEKQAVREMYNLLNEYADKLYGPEEQPSANKAGESDGSDSEEEDIEEAMKKEVDAMKEKKPTGRRFQNTNTKSRNTIFIKTTLEDPSTLAHTILTDIYNNGIQKSRFAIRMLPISNSCKCRLEDIENLGKKLFKKYFETPFGTGLSYTTVFTKRNNTEISRETVIPKLGQIIKELNPLHRVNHVTPDYVILVEIIGNICCISVVQDFFKFKKYNLIEVSKLKNAKEEEKQNKNENKEKEAGSENEKEDDDDDDDEAEDKSESQIQNKSEDDENESGCDDAVNGNRKRKREFSCEPEEVLLKDDGENGSISRETTVVMEKVPTIEAMNRMVRNQTVAMESLDRSETIVMESLPRTETVVMQSLDQAESVMDALSKGESIMDMGSVPGESTMEVLTKGESVMDSF